MKYLNEHCLIKASNKHRGTAWNSEFGVQRSTPAHKRLGIKDKGDHFIMHRQ